MTCICFNILIMILQSLQCVKLSFWKIKKKKKETNRLSLIPESCCYTGTTTVPLSQYTVNKLQTCNPFDLSELPLSVPNNNLSQRESSCSLSFAPVVPQSQCPPASIQLVTVATLPHLHLICFLNFLWD